ncbi:MAG: hypothetical protein KAV42_08320 [Candidatus Krumholzibacteria bacterium]|nr:hypothetical protein [Candidatus Krumholzibacteria bacterium]
MKMNKTGLDRIEKAMKKVWKKNRTLEIDDSWRAGVMREIRVMDTAPAEENGGLFSQGLFIWRFTAIAAAFALLFVLYAVRSDMTTLGDLAIMMLEDPVSFILSPPFV